MEVTISGNLITILKDDGTEQVINGLTVVDEGAIKWLQYNTAPPILTSDPYTQPTPTSIPRYKVVIHFNDNRWETIYMGEVTNQAGWTDDLTGANQAVTDLSAALVVSGGGGGGVSSVSASSPLASSGGATPNITFVGPISSDDVTDDSTIGGGGQDLTTTLDQIAAAIVPAPVDSVNGQTGIVVLEADDIDIPAPFLFVTIEGILSQEPFRYVSGTSYERISDPADTLFATAGFWRVFLNGTANYISDQAVFPGPPQVTTSWTIGSTTYAGGVSQEYSGTVYDVLIQLGQGVYEASEILTGNTLWVDAVNGDDATGVSGRQDRPFLTLTAAKTAATAGDLIRVRPGTYDEKNLLKNGVNWYFEQGSKVIYTGATDGSIFDDGPDGSNGPVVCTIDGFGEFEWTNDFGAATTNFGVVHIQNAGSNVVINGLSIENSGNNFQYGWTVLQEKGLLTVNMAQKIHSLAGSYNLGWYGGTGWINAPDINGEKQAISWIGDATGGDWYVNADSIIGGSSDILIASEPVDTVGALWVTAKLIKGDMSNGIVSGVSGKVYINAQKMWNTNASAPVVNSSGLFLWATVQKMTAESGQFFRCEASSGTVILEVQQYESKLVGEVVSTYGSIYNEGANLTLIGGVMTITNAGETQKGLEHVDGITLVKGMTFDLTGNDQADSYPVLVSGAGLALECCTLEAPSVAPSVGGTSVSFASNGTIANRPLAATVTALGNFFYNQGGPTVGQVPTANADGSWSWA